MLADIGSAFVCVPLIRAESILSLGQTYVCKSTVHNVRRFRLSVKARSEHLPP